MTGERREKMGSARMALVESQAAKEGVYSHKELKETVDASTSSTSRETEERADAVGPCCIESRDPLQKRR